MGEKNSLISSDDIIRGIINNDRKTLEYVYKTYFSKVSKFVVECFGTRDDAWDVFQEGILSLIDTVKKDGFELRQSFASFFVTICKHIWLLQLRNRGQLDLTRLGNIDVPHMDEEELIINSRVNAQLKVFNRHFRKLDIECKKLIRSTMKNKSGNEMAEQLNISSRDYAYKKRRLCLEKLFSMIIKDPEFNKINDYEAF
jgi:RNA polymerase sigma factor (sigma-70 family)